MASTSPSRDGRTTTGWLSVWRASMADDLFGDHVGVKPDAAVLLDLAVDALDLDLEAREGVEALLEHQQVVDHRLGPLGEPFAGHDGGDAGRIDHERRGGDAAGDAIDRQVVDVVAGQGGGGIARRHRNLRQVLERELPD